MIDREELELLGKLQVKAGRTVLRHALIMVGNALLLSFLFVALVLVIWFVVWQTAGPAVRAYAGSLTGLDEPSLVRLVMQLIGVARILALVLLLCPGLGFRICGSIMKP